MTINPFAHLTKPQQELKLRQLSEVYARLIAGEHEVQIDDEGRVGVRYTEANLVGLANLIGLLQRELGKVSAADQARHHRAIPIRFCW